MPEAVIRRIGGSTFAKLPPALVKEMRLAEGDMVQIEVKRRGATAADLRELFGACPDMPRMTADDRPWQDQDG